jgi:hypothetical protein
VSGGIRALDMPPTHRYVKMALDEHYCNKEGRKTLDPAAVMVVYIN